MEEKLKLSPAVDSQSSEWMHPTEQVVEVASGKKLKWYKVASINILEDFSRLSSISASSFELKINGNQLSSLYCYLPKYICMVIPLPISQ